MTDSALLERVLTDADPARTPRESAPDLRAIALRDRILRDTRAPRQRRAIVAGWASGLTVAAASAVVAVAVMVPQNAAVAGTPLPLEFDAGGTAAQILDDAQAALATSDGPAGAERAVQSASWSFAVDMGTRETEVVPQLVTTTWNPDLSGRTVAIEGVPYDPADAAANVGSEISSSGEVAWELDMAPGEFAAPVVDMPAATPENMRAVLEAYWLPSDPTGFDVVAAISSAKGQWTLTNAQESEMLGILEQVPGVEALGTSTDRLERPVTALRVPSPDGTSSDVVLLSADTGRIVGVERTNLLDNEAFAAGAIISYQLWDIEGIL